MRVKLFSRSYKHEVDNLESEMNQWLTDHEREHEIISIHTATAEYATLVMVVYEPKNTK